MATLATLATLAILDTLATLALLISHVTLSAFVNLATLPDTSDSLEYTVSCGNPGTPGNSGISGKPCYPDTLGKFDHTDHPAYFCNPVSLHQSGNSLYPATLTDQVALATLTVPLALPTIQLCQFQKLWHPWQL